MLDNLPVFLIILLGSGIVISAVGGLLVKTINYCYKPRWYKPATEIDYWRGISNEKEFTRTKIDRRWNFYVANLNSAFATLLSLVAVYVLYLIYTLLIIILGIMFIIFATLATAGYCGMLNFDKKLKEDPMKI